MLAYWIMFLLPVIFLLPTRMTEPDRGRLALYAFGLLIIWFAGLRYLVGCDWYSYEGISTRVGSGAIWESFQYVEPIYGVINWFSERVGWRFYGVNVACAAVFAYGFVRFAHRQPAPLLFAIVAFPLLIVTVVMGYTRQGAAIGILMLAFNAFVDRKMFSYLALVSIAAGFHSTAIIFVPAAIFLTKRQHALPATAFVFIAATVALSVLEERINGLINLYFTSDIFEGASSAALYRIGLNTVAAALFFIFYRAWKPMRRDKRFYTIFLGVSITSFLAIPFSPVAADRLALYFLPLQAAVFARMPLVIGGRRGAWPVAMLIVIAFCVLMWYWFRFATHSTCWVPYQNVTLPQVW